MQSTPLLLRQVSAKQAAAVASRMLSNPQNYSAALLSTVLFKPESVKERPDGTLAFPWQATKGSLNGFKSVHGGALSTLADAFTKVHAKASSPESKVNSISFEISFLSAVFQEKSCACVTRLVSRTDNIVFTDFAFEDEATGEVYARGTHVVSLQ